jgi:uncharacterized repeat protein (TIGR03843 family)
MPGPEDQPVGAPAVGADGDTTVELDPASLHQQLTTGELEILGRIPWASNATLLARVTLPGDDGPSALVIYKPERGERPLWDFPPGLYQREVAAYEVSEALGWGLVPPTVARDGPAGTGSVQLFVRCQDNVTAFDLIGAEHPAMPVVAAFDVVINNADRKGGHTLLDPDGRVWAIDHGVCFADEPKLRTVIWDFAGEPVPGELLGDLRRLAAQINGGTLGRRLRELLSAQELRTLRRRALRLAERGTFPEPTGGRPYPWPLI